VKVPLLGLVAVAPLLVAPAAAHKANHPPYTNCTKFNDKYPHGVGRVGARNRAMNGGVLSDPVTNFRRSNAIFAAAMAHNKGLDRDKGLREGVAFAQAHPSLRRSCGSCVHRQLGERVAQRRELLHA
jgi:Excalibur calcium-binding domain